MAAEPAHTSAVARRSSALLVSVAVMGAGGLAFNAIAARQVPADELGVQASLFFWMTLINQLTSMGLPVAVARLPRYAHTPSEQPLLLWAFVYTTASSAVGAALFFLVEGHRLRPEVHEALGVWGGGSAFLVIGGIVTGLSLALLVEIRLMALGLGRWVIIRAVFVNVTRCALLLVPALRREPMMLLILNAGINAATGVLGAVVLARWSRHESQAPMVPLPPELPGELRFATVNWAGTIALLVAQFGFPVIADITPAENAAFYLAWQIMAVVFVIPITVGHVVVVEASRAEGHDSRAPFRKGLTLSVALTGAAAIASFVLAAPFTRIVFGSKYATTADVLPWLVLAAVPWCVTSLLLARARADGSSVGAIGITSLYGVVVLVGAVVFTRNDAVASAVAWLVANVVAACASVAFSRIRSLRAVVVHSAPL